MHCPILPMNTSITHPSGGSRCTGGCSGPYQCLCPLKSANHTLSGHGDERRKGLFAPGISALKTIGNLHPYLRLMLQSGLIFTFFTFSPLVVVFSDELESRGQLLLDLSRIQCQSTEEELNLAALPSGCTVKSCTKKGRG